MLDRVVRTIHRYRMVAPGQRVAVAVSGGADSVCLLHLLVELAAEWKLELSVLHLNHQLRGQESRQDAEFVRELAAHLGLPVTIRDVAVADAPGNLEQAAREARLAFFRETIAGRAADRVAVGHTRSDQAETVLYRFLRGSGTAGLAGIRPVTSDGIIRPLLDVERGEVERFLRERGMPWREDSTNATLDFDRNRIRHELLPQLARDWNPAIAETLAHVADWALAEEAWWESELDRLVGEHLTIRNGAVLLRTESLMSLPLAVQRRLVRRAMEIAKGDLRGIDFHHVATALRLAGSVEGSGRYQAPGLDIFRSFDWVRFAKPGENGLATRDYQFPVTIPGALLIPGTGLALSMELVEKSGTSESGDSVYNNEMGSIDWRSVAGPLEVRNWRPGDRYQPIGSTGEDKIKSLFQEARIPLWERRHWPILTDGNSIIWARRFGPAARFAANSTSRVVLVIRETQDR